MFFFVVKVNKRKVNFNRFLIVNRDIKKVVILIKSGEDFKFMDFKENKGFIFNIWINLDLEVKIFFR